MPVTRYLIKATGIMLLWLLSVVPSAAAPSAAPRLRAHCEQTHATGIKRLARHTLSVGRSLIRIRKVGHSLLTRRAYFQRAVRTPHAADDDSAIQNDAPAAYFHVDPVIALQPIGEFVVIADLQLFAINDSPRAPRGPPAAA